MTALVTPFKGGEVDYDAYAALIERQIAAGTRAVIPVGTTGESATLSEREHIAVVTHCVETVKGRIPVIAGAGSNNTVAAIRLAEQAEGAGADALLATTGYYNKPPQSGIEAHYRHLAEATDLPILVYNVPGRTQTDVAVETLARLSTVPTIVGVKDATGDLGRVALHRRACGKDFIQLSGEDMTAVGYNAMGGQGCISVTANVAPEQCAQLQDACLNGRFADALELQDRLTALHEALFVETSPGPTKYALARLGLCREELRLPLVPTSERSKAAVDRALDELGLL
ncbi:4-hydroxy-tetrahydrodipicolinate synthase [Parvularcula bermudensis]|nr:4-hydroxy-tetrahydrodipicolinate synthase [Parvularcula bermudensis]